MNYESNTALSNQIILEDDSQYLYSIRPFELRNALGNIVAILQEYIFIKKAESEQQFEYKLYKTKEGNWYDISDIKSSENNVLRSLKRAIDRQPTLIN